MSSGNGSATLSFFKTKQRLAATSPLKETLHIAENRPQALPLAALRKRRSPSQALRWYRLTDTVALLLGFVCAWGIAALINGVFFGRPLSDPLSEYGAARMAQFALIAGGVLLWFAHTGHQRVRMPFWLETKRIVSALAIAMLADGFLQFAAKQELSRLWLMAAWMISGAAMIGLRAWVRQLLRSRGLFQVRTLLVGNGETAKRTQAALYSEPSLGYEITSHIKDLPTAFLQAGNSWETLCTMHGADYIIIALDGEDMNAALPPLAQLARESVPFSVSPPLPHLPVFDMMPHYFFSHDVMLMTRSSGLEQPVHCLLKRAMDVVASGLALIVLSPLMVALALTIRRDGGPALYGHLRVGKDGKSFKCLKFRSMVMNGDAVLERYLEANPEARTEWQASRKLKNDPRVTKLGDFLRRSSLDELPQLINVLRGEMSLVGPRPIVAAEIANYDGDIAHYYRVRPGVTGLWQVSGRSDVSYPQRVHMDSWYVRNWSLWHDIAIICKTFPALMKRSGAY